MFGTSTSAFAPAFLPVAPLSARPTRLRARPATCCRPRRRTFAVAQGEHTQNANTNPAHLPDPTSDSTSGSVPDPERAERARLARVEAERLELLAAKARLDVERAELAAERKRLELDKIRSMREIQRSADGAATTELNSSDATASVSSDSATTNEKDNTADSVVKAVKVQSGTPPKITSGTLSDLLGSEFPRVSERDINVIRERLCGMDTFFVTEVDRSPFDERVVFRGNMRMDASTLLTELEDRAKKEGIAERVRLFLLVDPKESPLDEDEDNRPVLVALPSSALPNQTSPLSAVFSVVVFLAAFFTSFSYGIGIFGLTPEVISEIAKGNSDEALLTLPISVGTMALSFIHDFGHRFMAQLRDIRLGLPFFLPSLQIGNYGVITPLETYPAQRKDLFDVAAAGPILGSVCSLIALIGGLVVTAGGNPMDWFPQVPSALFHGSILVGSLADTILPAALREQATIAVHPMTVVGYTGLLVNALNLMPIGRLDGGRIVQALYGRAVAARLTAITLLVQGFGALLGNSPLLLFWGLVCVFLQRESDIPCRNEVVEPDTTRTAVGLACLVLMLLVLIPFPDQVGDVLSNL